MGGGDLLNLLIERDVFEEDFTRFYVAEVRPKALIIRSSHVLTFLPPTSLHHRCRDNKDGARN